MAGQRIDGIAPDGSTVSTEIDPDRRDEDMCIAAWGPEGTLQALCTEPRDHPGPWHVAASHTEIVKVWAVSS